MLKPHFLILLTFGLLSRNKSSHQINCINIPISHNILPDLDIPERSPLKSISYKGSDFIKRLLCSRIQKQHLEPSKPAGIVTDGNYSETSYEDNKSTSQLKLTALQCCDKPGASITLDFK